MYRIASGAAGAMQIIQNLFCVRRQIYQVSALYRLLDDHGLVVFAADLVAFSALYGGIFVIHVVELDLYHLDLRYSCRISSSTSALSWKEIPKGRIFKLQ